MRIKDLATRATKLLTGNAYMVFDNGTKVEKVDYAELAKQIITEYNTQTLAGSAQSVKSALDALNSNSVAKRGVLNSVSIDLDDYTSPGVWLCTNVVTNIPERTYGELIVTASGPASQEVFQRFYTLQESPVCYIRQRNSNAWNPWVKLPTRAEVDALNTYLSTPRVEFKGLQNDETVNSGSITVTKAGLYLVKFELAHCGANNITNVGAYWNVDLRNSSDAVVSQYNQVRATIAIPLAKVWDYEVNAIGIYNLSAGGIYHAKFRNNSGIATDSGYNSGVGIFMKYLGN